jgi:hypothetical protein
LILTGRTGWIPEGTAPSSPTQWARFLRSDCPGELAVKPISGNYGSGIRILTRTDNDRFSQLGDAPITCEELAEHLFHDTKHSGYILQERIHNHPDLLALSQAQGLQCVRLIVMTDPQGQSHILHAHLKIIVGDNPHDNFQFGTSGNLLARVDVTTGNLSPALNGNPAGPGYIEHTHHPLTRQQVAGLSLPHWQATCHLVRNASQILQPLRVIGWDVAITPHGPVLIEGNWSSDPPNPFRNLDTFCEAIRRLES